jgi:hypothetical protein
MNRSQTMIFSPFPLQTHEKAVRSPSSPNKRVSDLSHGDQALLLPDQGGSESKLQIWVYNKPPLSRQPTNQTKSREIVSNLGRKCLIFEKENGEEGKRVRRIRDRIIYTKGMRPQPQNKPDRNISFHALLTLPGCLRQNQIQNQMESYEATDLRSWLCFAFASASHLHTSACMHLRIFESEIR